MEALEAGVELGVGGAGLRDAGEVAFDVGGEDGDADAGEGLGHDLEGDGLAGAGGSGDEAMAVAHGGEEREGVGGGGFNLGDDEGFGHADLRGALGGRRPLMYRDGTKVGWDATLGTAFTQGYGSRGDTSTHNAPSAFSVCSQGNTLGVVEGLPSEHWRQP